MTLYNTSSVYVDPFATGYEDIIAMWERNGYYHEPDMTKAFILCFGGGADVDPSLYGEKNAYSFTAPAHDRHNLKMLEEARKNPDRLLVGICRGAQFLNVMMGGKLWQDVDKHTVGNRGHMVNCYISKKKWFVNSYHHQMMRPGPEAIILATASESTLKRAEKEQESGVDLKEDHEVLMYQTIDGLSVLCFQPHPEWCKRTEDYFLAMFWYFTKISPLSEEDYSLYTIVSNNYFDRDWED